ncbi:MAG TPA: nitrite reductase large subunit NirB [Solirubrobacteraceae bacterium]|nr:nitrite reductase large subunit NirB [Solirubrobacteraceae bacterium]
MPSSPSKRPPRVLVIGGGIAGQAVCEQLDGHACAITLVCGEPHLPYDRVNLGRLLKGAEPANVEDLLLRPATWYADRGIEVHLETWIEQLDPERRLATTHSGTEIPFDYAVLCTGSTALVPPLANVAAPGVHVFRDPGDCAEILAAAQTADRAAVIGGGLLGLEAAHAIASRGVPTTVVHLMDRLMERQLDPDAAALLAPAMEELGVEVLLERRTQGLLVNPDGHVGGLAFADGGRLDADLVVVAIGIRPHVDLARASGLAVNRGVVVDDRLISSHPRVLAVGECAEHRGVVHGIVAPIREQAAVAAATISGHSAAYAGSIPSAKLKVMGVELFAAGEPDADHAVALRNAETGAYRKLVIRDGRVTGAILMGDTRGADLLLDRIRTRAPVEDPLALLAEASQASAEDLPDSAQVCNCNGVCKGTIVAAIRAGGLGSTQEVVAVTRAGAGCGSCKPVVSELLAIERGGAGEEPAYLCPCRKLTREQVAGRVRADGLESVSEIAQACGAGRDCGACKPGLAYLVSEICGNRHREERHARFINDRVHANIQNDGTFSVVPRMRGGVTSADELRRIADVVDKYEIPMVKVTGGQRIDLLGVPKEQLPAIWEELGMPSGHAYAKAVRTVKTCVGTDFCRFGLGNSIALGIELETAMEGLYTPHKVKSAVTGCPRNCAEAYVKDIGLVAVEGGWEIYVGGAAGSTVRKGDRLTTVASPEAAKRVALAFLQHYRESAEYLERTYTYIERVGIDAVRAAVLGEGQAELIERYGIAKAAADPDPWRERHHPATPKQFEELDTEAMLVGPPAGAAR